MADKRITDLPILDQAESGDYVPIVDSSINVTKRVAPDKVVPIKSLGVERIDGGESAGVLVSDGDGVVSVQTKTFHAETVTFSSGTGSKTLTGFGFQPKEVQFILNYTGHSVNRQTIGGAVDLGEGSIYQYVSTGSSQQSNSSSDAMNSRCMRAIGADGGLLFAASFVSFDPDGITITVNNDNASARSWFVIARA